VRRLRFDALALLTSACFIALHLWADGTPVIAGAHVLRGIHALEGRATDLQFRVRGPRAPHPDLILATVDERGAQRYGRWPWSRSLIARALSRLHQAGVRAVGVDVIFTDEDRNEAAAAYRESLEMLDRTLGQQAGAQVQSYRTALRERASESADQQLALTLRQMPELVQGVVAYPRSDLAQFQDKVEEQGALLAPLVFTQLYGRIPGSVFSQPIATIPSWPNYSAQMPLPILAAATRRVGHLNTVPDPDGVLRRAPVFTKLEHPVGLLPALEVATAAAYFDATIEPVYDPNLRRLVAARLRPKRGPSIAIPIETSEPFSLINYLGKGAALPSLSVSDLIDGKFNPAELAGKVVLFGVTLVGEYDQRVTPFAEMEAGLYVRASFLSNILSQQFMTRPAWLRLVEIAFIAIVAFGFARALPRARHALKLLIIVLALVAWLLIGQSFFTRGLKLATVIPLCSVFGSSFAILFLGYFSVEREKGQLRGAFRHYLNETVMEQMLEHPERLRLGGEKREMTVLFSDIRGFTALSERISPETLVRLMNSYLTPMTEIVFEEGGTLDKYIGDALMAFWGAPLEQPEHALHACRTAVRFTQKLSELKMLWAAQGLPELEIGVGVNTGPMIVGNMGSDLRFNYTVMGDAVNLASRLEALNKEYKTRILISESTFLLVRGQVSARKLGRAQVRGKQAPVPIYELRNLDLPSQTDRMAIENFELGVDALGREELEAAERAFEQVLRVWPGDSLSLRCLGQIRGLRRGLRPSA
jgi:adenylate cyclase